MIIRQNHSTKHNLKFTIVAVVSAAVVSVLLPVAANAATVNVNCSGGGSFRIQDNVVISSAGCAGEANIPSGVIEINDDSFGSSAAAITKVVIPSTVTYIGRRAFAGATLLTELIIPNSVTVINDQAFMGATSLRSLTLGAGLQEIASGVFSGASSLTVLSIPSNVTIIGAGSFSNSTSLTKVIIPSATWFIADGAFSGTTSLRSIYFLGAAPLLGDNPFPFLNSSADATAYVTTAHLASFSLSSDQEWNGFAVTVGDPVASDFIIQMDDGAEAAEAAAAAERAAAKAAKAAEARREAERKAARADVVTAINNAKELTLETFSKADIPGINASNIASVQSELLALPIESRGDINQVLKIARKYEVVGLIASDQVANIFPNTFVEIGLIPETSKNKVLLASAVKKLPLEARDSLSEIKAAIEAASAVIQKRADRLAKVLADQSTRNGN